MTISRILVVDDDTSLLTALKSALHLRMDDVLVETVDSGDAALERLEVSEFDVVITDIKMPGMDGLTLLREIRKCDPDLPALLITGHGQHDLAVQALRGGAFDFIQKPIDRDYLIAALGRAIQIRRLQRTILSQQLELENHAAELEQTVQQRTRTLEDLNQSKDQFLAMLAHELRNPLACIRHAVDLLDVSPSPAESHQDLLNVMSRQVTHMTHLLDDLLDVSRISRNEIKLRIAPVEMGHVLTDAVEALQPMFDEYHHTFILNLPHENVVVKGDRSRLEQIIVNLLNNAVKYTDPGGRIALSLEFDESEAIITVEDNGIGISEQMLQKVFDLFSQVDRSLDRARGGLGIGLTLVKNLVSLHGGSVEAGSDGEGFGSTFIVRLPAAKSATPAETQRARVLEKSDRFKVLLVEDNSTLAKLTSDLLKNCGHDVVAVVSDGASAIDATCSHLPEYVFLDIGIPKIDGYEVARRLRKNSQLRNLKLVALTGYGREEDRQRSKEAGFDHHLTKPLSVDALSELFSSDSEKVLT